MVFNTPIRPTNYLFFLVDVCKKILVCILTKNKFMRYIILILLAFAFLQAFRTQEPITITGTIADHEGTPLAGVSIIVKGTKMGTTTDQSGFFSISIPNEKFVLVIQYVGYVCRLIRL
jgi:hypothetical protein